MSLASYLAAPPRVSVFSRIGHEARPGHTLLLISMRRGKVQVCRWRERRKPAVSVSMDILQSQATFATNIPLSRRTIVGILTKRLKISPPKTTMSDKTAKHCRAVRFLAACAARR